jgi:hypothetical protein
MNSHVVRVSFPHVNGVCSVFFFAVVNDGEVFL